MSEFSDSIECDIPREKRCYISGWAFWVCGLVKPRDRYGAMGYEDAEVAAENFPGRPTIRDGFEVAGDLFDDAAVAG